MGMTSVWFQDLGNKELEGDISGCFLARYDVSRAEKNRVVQVKYTNPRVRTGTHRSF
ncbi:hypothetical protein GCM10007385_06990 [Tateyamaria omphalii]|nr:hypothetical protein GCM10007385_06990 [Tateyamaria omphalii]